MATEIHDQAAVAAAQAETARLRALVEATRSRTGGEALADTGLSLLQGAVGLGQAAYGVGNIATLGLLDRAVGLSGNFDETQNILNQAKSAPMQRDMLAGQEAFDRGVLSGLAHYITNPALLGDVALQSAPSLLPAGAVAGRVARGVAALETPAAAALAAQRATRAGITTAALQSAGAVNVDAINRIAEAGGSELEQQLGGLAAGAIAGPATAAISRFTGAGALEAAVAARLAGVLPTTQATSVARGIVAGMAREGGEEALQSGVEQAATNLFAPGVSVTEDVGEQAAVGGLLGSLLGGGLGTVASFRPRTPQREALDEANREAAEAAGAAPTGTLTEVAGYQVDEVPNEDIAITQLPIVEQTPEERLMEELALAEAAQGMGVEELPAASPLPLPVPQVEELSAMPDAQEITSRAGTPMWFNLREGLDLFGDPVELAALGRAAPAQDEQARAVSPQQADFGFTVPPQSSLQQMLAEQLGIDARSQYQPIDWVEGQLMGPEFALPNPANLGAPVQSVAPAEPVTDDAAPFTDLQQGALQFESAAPGWKAFLSRELGVKPGSLQGPNWKRFVDEAQAAGVQPGPDAAPFVQRFVAQFADQEESAPTFVTRMAERFPVEVAVEPAAPAAPAVEQLPASEAIQSRARDLAADGEPATVSDAIRDLLDDSTDVNDLDETWAAIAATPEFRALPTAESDALVDYFNQYYDGLENNRFFRTSRETDHAAAISNQQFTDGLETFNAVRAQRGRPPVVGHETVADFRAATGAAAPNDASGVYMPDGTLHVIRENTNSRKELAFTLLHEQGHEGLRGLLGDRIAAVTNRLWANPSTRERIRARQKAEGLTRARAAEEVLVDMLAGKEKLAASTWAKMRAAVKQTAARLFGAGDLYVSDTQVDALLRDTARYIASPETTNLTGGQIADTPRWRTLDEVLGDPDRAFDVPAYSRTMRDLREATEQPALPGPPIDGLNAATKSMFGAARKMVAEVVGKGRGARNVALDLLPLNWLAETYDGDMTVDTKAPGMDQLREQYGDEYRPLTELYRANDQKSAEALRVTHRDRAVTYNGETFTTSPKTLAGEWETLGRKNREAFNALNVVQQYGTYYRVWPDRGWEAQAPVDYSKHGFNEAERHEAWQHLRKQWQRLGPAGQAIYKKSQGLYEQMWQQRMDELQASYARLEGVSDAQKARVSKEVAESLKRLREGPYSPLSRAGDHMITVRDELGQTVLHSAYDTDAEAAEALPRMSAELTPEQVEAGWTVTKHQTSREYNPNDGFNYAEIARLESVADGMFPSVTDEASPEATAFRNQLKQALLEVYLQSLPTHSLMQHANARKGVAGFSLDSFRAFNDYALKAARNIASIKYDSEITEHLQNLDIPARQRRGGDTSLQNRVALAARRQYRAASEARSNKVADAITQAGFLYYLTGPSQMVLNGTQVAQVTFPRLAGRYGAGNTIRALTNATKTFFASGRDILGAGSTVTGAVRQVIDNVGERGKFDPGLTNDMSSIANGDYSTMSARRRRAMEMAGFFMRKSEEFNRQVTALAAIELAMKDAKIRTDATLTPEQIDTLTRVAEHAIDTTHFNYSKHNAPVIMQGPWRRVVMQFQTYPINMLAMMARDVRTAFKGKPAERKEALATLSWMLTSQMALTGALGTTLSPFVFALADVFRDEDELLDSRTAFARAVPGVLAHGVFSGFLDTTRIGGDTLVPVLGQAKYAPRDASPDDTVAYHVMQQIGPWAGLASDLFSGVDALAKGDFREAWNNLPPKPLRDIASAVYSLDGVKDRRGVVYYDPTFGDVGLQLLGLRSGTRRDVEALRGATYQATMHAAAQRKAIIDEGQTAYLLDDAQGLAIANARRDEWNTKYPDLAVKGSDMSRAVRSAFRAQETARQYGVPLSGPPAPSILNALNFGG